MNPDQPLQSCIIWWATRLIFCSHDFGEFFILGPRKEEKNLGFSPNRMSRARWEGEYGAIIWYSLGVKWSERNESKVWEDFSKKPDVAGFHRWMRASERRKFNKKSFFLIKFLLFPASASVLIWMSSHPKLEINCFGYEAAHKKSWLMIIIKMFMAVRLQSENGHNGDSYIHLAPARTRLEDLCFMLELFISLIISEWYL